MKKRDPRGRKSKVHKPIEASFDEVLFAIGKSKYTDKKTLKKRTKKRVAK